jgi:hypothetical protein
MKQNQIITTAVLFLLVGTTLPSFAQKGEEQKGGGKAPQEQRAAQPQRAQPAQRAAQPQRAQQTQRAAQPQRAQQTQRAAQPQRAQQAQQPARQQSVANNRGGGQHGRISNVNYTSHFGRGHSFHMGRPQMIGGYNRFQYGGYSFGYNQAWPVGWGYDDNCYVVYQDGGYFMYDLMHPGIYISLSIF